jgi:hypothetical protein
VALASCAPTTTYGYQYRLDQQFGTGGEQPEAPNVEARQLLAQAKTIAFYPPDSCLNTETSKGDHELGAGCGTVMSKLERAAEQAGYEVMSWQNLRPPRDSDKRPIDYARDAHVDVLFEINELDVNAVDDTKVRRTLTFFKDNNQPLPVTTELARACADYAVKRDPVKLVGLSGSVDIKTVAVSDGRDRWHYRKTEDDSLDRTYPRVTFAGQGHMHRLARAGLVVGGVLIGLGIEFIVLQSATHEDPTPLNPNPKNTDFSPWDYLMIGVGVPVLVGGIYAAMHLKSEPPVDKVLCDEQHAVVQTGVVQAGTLSAEHTFTETKVDENAQEIESLRADMLRDFIRTLTEVHGGNR